MIATSPFTPRAQATRTLNSTLRQGFPEPVAVGSFAPRKLRRGGLLRWGDRDLELRPAILAFYRFVRAADGA